MELPSERIIEDANEICRRLNMEPLTKSQLLIVSLVVGHEIEKLEERLSALERLKESK